MCNTLLFKRKLKFKKFLRISPCELDHGASYLSASGGSLFILRQKCLPDKKNPLSRRGGERRCA